MDNFPFQLLSSALVALTTLIPNDSLRYMALGSTLLTLVGYVVFVNNLSSQAAQCEISMPEIETLFTTVTNECVRDPRFITEAGLQLTFEITWKAYPLHLRIVLLSIAECRRTFRGLRSSMQIALEHARQQAYSEDINQRRRTLEVAFVREQADIEQSHLASSRANSHLFLTSILFDKYSNGNERTTACANCARIVCEYKLAASTGNCQIRSTGCSYP
ncbi:hypothetical protein C8J57DRAFT_1244349 [Mycena rebaudengoi]|nr:hypothetical protein C8J57DRAFT_1244349 [Mycena rebaudengoi]